MGAKVEPNGLPAGKRMGVVVPLETADALYESRRNK